MQISDHEVLKNQISVWLLQCLEEDLYPSWDAQNMLSVHLAEKLGYEFDHEYTVYEVASDEITH